MIKLTVFLLLFVGAAVIALSKKTFLVPMINFLYNKYSVLVSLLGLAAKLKPSSAYGIGGTFEDGVPYQDWGYQEGQYIGKKASPNLVASKLKSYSGRFENLSNEEKNEYQNLVQWLLNNATDTGEYAVYKMPYPFVAYSLKEGWVSGMGQANAITALTKAYQCTKNEQCFTLAKKLLNAYEVDVEQGGLRWKCDEHDGWWYAKRAAPNASRTRVLNAFQFILIQLAEFYKETQDERAKQFFDKGLNELKAHLRDYETEDEWTYYDALKIQRSTTHYHAKHIEHLETLYEITHDLILKEYAEKWKGILNIS